MAHWVRTQKGNLCNLDALTAIVLARHSDDNQWAIMGVVPDADSDDRVLAFGTKAEMMALLRVYGDCLVDIDPARFWQDELAARQENRQEAVPERQETPPPVPRCTAKDRGIRCDKALGHPGEHCFIPF